MPQSYIFYYKCSECKLEFVIFSCEEGWNEKQKPFCPECGKQEANFLRKAVSEKPIFELDYK